MVAHNLKYIAETDQRKFRTSIVIPLFNQKEYFVEAIESALAQTVPVEIIVVDDGSTDGGRFLADEYADRATIVHQVNKGLASARNTGIMNATGEFILPLDADDILLPTCVERIERVFDDTDATVVAPSFSQFGLAEGDVILTPRPTFNDFLPGNKVGYCSAIKRSVLLAIGGYSPKMVWGFEDYHLWFNILKLGGKIHTIAEPLWKYRLREGSMISVANQHSQELVAQITKDFGPF